MKVQDLIDKLKEFPPDMEVECLVDWQGEDEPEFEPVSEVEMYNDHGNTVRIG